MNSNLAEHPHDAQEKAILASHWSDSGLESGLVLGAKGGPGECRSSARALATRHSSWRPNYASKLVPQQGV